MSAATNPQPVAVYDGAEGASVHASPSAPSTPTNAARSHQAAIRYANRAAKARRRAEVMEALGRRLGGEVGWASDECEAAYVAFAFFEEQARNDSRSFVDAWLRANLVDAS